jgi:RHS repeat-associated protein
MSPNGRRALALGSVLAVLFSSTLTVSATAAQAAGPGRDAPAVAPNDKPAVGRPGTVRQRRSEPDRAGSKRVPPKVSWPTGGSAVVEVGSGWQRVGGLPVKMSAKVGQTPVKVLDRAASARAGVTGLVLTLDGAADHTTVTASYADFAYAQGGDFGARLRFVQLPACALTTPEKAGCRQATALDTVNDAEARTVSTSVSGSTVLALTSGEESTQGDYGLTKLSPSSSWTTAPSSGAFQWSYPVQVPPVPGGLTPPIRFGYSSQAVDGMTSATNNQGSWIGDGFGFEPGYIERSYKPCAADGFPTKGDLCWAFHNATMSLGDRSAPLVKVSDDRWKLASDDGTKVERLTGSVNGAQAGEYWKVTTTDGTQYFFGRGRLPGWAAGKEETNSAWTVPVFGDDPGEPCYSSSGFSASSCDQAWRWNLDYVVDVHGNTMAYFYDRESNQYARDGRTDIAGASYHRGGYLRRIDYGQRDGSVYTTYAAARVNFTVAERCLPSGPVTCAPSQLTADNAAYWPDVPYDLDCPSGTNCKSTQTSPSFWTRKRLTKVQTETRTATGWSPVGSWTLEHLFRDNGDGSRTLWLDKLTRAGHLNGATITLPPVELLGEQKPNRIVTDGGAQLNRYRIATIYTESGAQIDVGYAPADCAADNLPTPGTSTRRCFPAVWKTLSGRQVTDWFHKYVVASVNTTDRVGGNPETRESYTYVGDAAWRKVEPNGITKDESLTWSDWRGYGKVLVTGGIVAEQTKVEHTYLRGMHGGKKPDGGTLSVSVTDAAGGSHVDYDQLSGFELDTITYDGAKVIGKTVSSPWRYITHTQSESWGTRYATMVDTAETRVFSEMPMANGVPQWRETKTVNTFDTTFGRVTSTDDLGDVTTATDDKCSRVTYTDIPAKYLYELAGLSETFSVSCGVSNPDRGTTLLSSAKTAFNDFGDPARWEKLQSATTTSTTYLLVSDTGVDQYGRATSVTDAEGSTATTTYYETYGLTTKIESFNALGHKTTTELDPATGNTLAAVDPNSKRTDMEYDALGRRVKVWGPDRAKATNPDTPSTRFSYLTDEDKPVVVRAETLRNNGTYRSAYQIFDGLARLRQVQQPGPDGYWLLTDTFYNSLGLQARTNDVYHATGTPGDLPIVVPDGSVNGNTTYLYDGAGRVTASIFSVGADERYRQTTTYNGNRVHTDPPAGGTPTTEVTDARGQLVELHQYLGAAPTGPALVTRYEYTPSGNRKKVTDSAGNIWSYQYNQQQQQIESNDPDTGKITYEYDKLGRLTSTTDAMVNKVSHVYDKLSRRRQTWQGDPDTGTKLAEWSYDGLWKGQLYWSARYTNGAAYGTVIDQRDAYYRALRTKYSIPAQAGAELAGSYEFTTAYNLDGTIRSVGVPKAGDLPAEVVTSEYDDLLRPTKLTGATPYVTATSYSEIGQLKQVTLTTSTGDSAKKVWQTWAYERGTGRLKSARLDRTDGPGGGDMDVIYSYDDTGNVKSMVDAPAGGQRDAQCFSYDGLRRLTQAWATASSDPAACDNDPNVSAVGGPAPYWESWTFDDTGNRKTETIHSTTGGANTERTYTYPAPGTPRPHMVQQVTETGPAGNKTHQYQYDETGNTKHRGTNGTAQDLKWDPEGRLASVTAGQTTIFTYSADGNRLLRKELNATTLYLPGMELRLDATSRTLTGTRFYTFAGRTIAVRNGPRMSFQNADHHGTANATIDAETGAITLRRTTPYGSPRGTQPSSTWPDQKGFVGGTKDDTGLTHLGAREYDPTLGRFISDDPVTDHADPQQINGYAYANNNPTTMSDPNGLKSIDDEEKRYENAPKTGGGKGCNGSTPSSRSASCQPYNDRAKALLGLKILGRSLTQSELEGLGLVYGYYGSQDFTLGDAIAHYRCLESGRCEGLRRAALPDSVNFRSLVCEMMGGTSAGCDPWGDVENPVADWLKLLPYGDTMEIPEKVAKAIGAYSDGQNATGTELLFSAVGGVRFKGSEFAGPIGEIVSSHLKDRVSDVVPVGTTLRINNDGEMNPYGPLPRENPESGWRDHKVLFPMPVAFYLIDVDDPTFITDLQQIGMIS